MAFDYAAHEAQMAAEIRHEVMDATQRFEVALANIRTGIDPERELDRLKRQSTNLRLLCTGIDERLLDLTVQRLANYLALVGEPTEFQLDDLGVFIDVMVGLTNGDIDSASDEAEFVRSLPVPRPAHLEDVAHLELEVLLVDPHRVSARFVARELQNCGFRVSTASRSYEALELAARTRPDLLITTAIIDEIDGTELCCMLRAAKATRGIPLALLTSFKAEDERLRGLPRNVTYLGKGDTFSNDLGDLLQRLQAEARQSATAVADRQALVG